MHYLIDQWVRGHVAAPDPCVPPEDARAPAEPTSAADGALPFRAPRRYRRRPLRLRERLAGRLTTHLLRKAL